MHSDEPTTSHRYGYTCANGTLTVTDRSTSVGNLAMRDSFEELGPWRPINQQLATNNLSYSVFDAIIVAAALQMPPVPWQIATVASGTWRSPHSPRSWRTASMRVKMPY